MRIGLASLFVFLLLAACEGSAPTGTGKCLYAIEMEFGQMMKWGSCSSPPANAIRRLSGPGSRNR
jgi:hypothetical protein